MTLGHVVWSCIFISQTALRKNAQLLWLSGTKNLRFTQLHFQDFQRMADEFSGTLKHTYPAPKSKHTLRQFVKKQGIAKMWICEAISITVFKNCEVAHK